MKGEEVGEIKSGEGVEKGVVEEVREIMGGELGKMMEIKEGE